MREERAMQEKKRLKYEKPVSIDMGRVAPILGDTCSVGDGAADCPAGMNNSSVPVCNPSGASADNDCRTGSGAGTFCWPTGFSAKVFCLAGSGYGVSTRSYSTEIQPDSPVEESVPVETLPTIPESTPETIEPEPENPLN